MANIIISEATPEYVAAILDKLAEEIRSGRSTPEDLKVDVVKEPMISRDEDLGLRTLTFTYRKKL